MLPRVVRRLGLPWILLALAAPLPLGAQGRPSLGLALGGGGARGVAHIGLLRWLEEHRVPVDYVAGASMGGLVGGAYASGMSASEIETLIREAEWDVMFLADSPFKHKTFRRKEDARSFPAQIDIGLRGGFKLPSGLNPGQQVQLMLDRIAAPYEGLETFDDLPTPFRAVAADLAGSGLAVLHSGSLSRALRATIAIPGVFTPVELDGRRLVDGGTLNNVPADVVRSMGADFVVAVNVSSTTDGPPPPPENLFDVLGQTMDLMMAEGVIRALREADRVVTPDLRGLSGLDWSRREELIERGYQAAESARSELLAHAVDPMEYETWRRDRESRRRHPPAQLSGVRVVGLAEEAIARIEGRLEGRLAGRPFDRAAVEREILLLSGRDQYALVRYAFEGDPARLALFVSPRENGPPFLLPALDLQNIDSNTFALNLRGRFVFYDPLFADTEVRADFAAGTRETASVEIFRRIGSSPLFVTPRGYWHRQGLNSFDGEGRLVAEYREKTAGGGIDLGFDLGSRNEVRLGYDTADVRSRLSIGEPSFPEAEGANRFASIRWTFDGQTSPVIPTRGIYSRLFLRYYLASPDLVAGRDVTAGPGDYAQGELRLSYFRRWKGRHRVFLGAAAGTSFGADPGYNEFRLGGLLRLGAFHNGEITGENYALGVGGVLYQVLRLPDVIGGQGYLGAWIESGSAFERWGAARVEWNASGGFVLETFLGPFFMGGSVSLNTGDGRFYVSLGPFVR